MYADRYYPGNITVRVCPSDETAAWGWCWATLELHVWGHNSNCSFYFTDETDATTFKLIFGI